MRSNAHIKIDQTIITGRPAVDMDLEELKTEGLEIENHEHGISAYASLEWAIPSFIFAYFTKPYFEGFLTEMGADHYRVFKEWVVKQNRKFKGFATIKITASKSSKKDDKSKSPSNYFALYFQTPQGNRLKVFMPETETDEQDVKALSEILDNLKKLYFKPKSKFTSTINGLTDKDYEDLYAVYNLEKKKWEYFTATMLIHKSIAKNKVNKKI
jgi:hypothetical protein